MKMRDDLVGLNIRELTNEEFDSIFDKPDLNVCDACGIIDKSENFYWKDHTRDVELLCKACLGNNTFFELKK